MRVAISLTFDKTRGKRMYANGVSRGSSLCRLELNRKSGKYERNHIQSCNIRFHFISDFVVIVENCKSLGKFNFFGDKQEHESLTSSFPGLICSSDWKMNSINLRLEDRHLEPLESSLRLGRAFDVTFGEASRFEASWTPRGSINIVAP